MGVAACGGKGPVAVGGSRLRIQSVNATHLFVILEDQALRVHERCGG